MFRGNNRRGTAHRKEVCELVPNPDETMEGFRTEIRKALWHVYNMLDKNNNEKVHISQLKVITSNIGLKLGFDKSEEILDKEGLNSMDYHTYFETVESDLLDKVEDAGENTTKTLGDQLTDVIKTCWTFCSFQRAKTGSSALNSDHCLKLWRLFNFLAETNDDNNPIIPVQLHREEAALLFNDFIDRTGQRNKQNIISKFSKSETEQNLSFSEFQSIFESNFVEGLTDNDVTMAINSIYGTYILDELAKGMMLKRGYKVKSWKERWLILTSTRLNYYGSPNERLLKGCIEIDKDCSIEVPADRPGQKPNRFILKTTKKPYEMSASDPRTKNEWVSAIQCALGRVGLETSLQQQAAQIRRRARKEKRLLAEEDERKRLDEADLLRNRLNELDEEKKRRAEAESRLEEEQLLREADEERLRQLAEINRELERLLEEERQAKRDEEIVRTLQARLLEDEFQKREELERLKKQQEEMLMAERVERADLESERQEQERALREAQYKLEQLEREKAAAADRMQEAAEKLQKAEKDRLILQEKVKLWKTPTVGLSGPLPLRAHTPVTHRGEGAFCNLDFQKICNLDFQKKMADRREKSESPVLFRKSPSDTDQNNEKSEDGSAAQDETKEINSDNKEDNRHSLELNNLTETSEYSDETQGQSHNETYLVEDNECMKHGLTDASCTNAHASEHLLEKYSDTNEQSASAAHELPVEHDMNKLSLEESDHEDRDSFESDDSAPIYDIPRSEKVDADHENQDLIQFDDTGVSNPIYDTPKGDTNVETDQSEDMIGDETPERGEKISSDDLYEIVEFP